MEKMMSKNKFNISSKRFTDDKNDVLNNLLDDSIDKLVTLDPKKIDTWILRDRRDFELGDLDELAASIKNRGQAQPIIIVRANKIFLPKKNTNAEYIVIAGYRRWMACSNHNLRIQAIIKDLSFNKAIECLKSENEKENVSDFSKGIFYNTLKEEYNYTLDQLSKNIGETIQQLHRLITFAKVPTILWDKVHDMNLVSSRTSQEILTILNKDKNALTFFMDISDKIRDGHGTKRILNLYEQWKNKSVATQDYRNKKISLSSTGIIKINLNNLNIDKQLHQKIFNKIQDLIEKES